MYLTLFATFWASSVLFLHLVVYYSTVFKGFSADGAEFSAASFQRNHSTFFPPLLNLFWSENFP